MTPIFRRQIQDALLWGSSGPFLVRLREFHPLCCRVPADFSSQKEVPFEAQNTTFPDTFLCRIQFALFPFRSLLVRVSRLISFPAGTKMLQFPAFAHLSVYMAMSH